MFSIYKSLQNDKMRDFYEMTLIMKQVTGLATPYMYLVDWHLGIH